MRAFLICLTTLSLATPVQAVEKLAIQEVDNDALISECQKTVNQPNGLGIVWFMPETVFFRMIEEGIILPPEQAAEIRTLLDGKCVVAIVRAHISPFGTFTFFDESTVLEGTKISVKKPDSDPVDMRQLKDVPQDLSLLIDGFKPVLANAMGRMGENFHFYVFDNANRDRTNIYDPYKDEKCMISFVKMGRLPETEADYDTICDSLFKPRFCKNGKRAHVTWKFDPWTGEALPE